MMERRERGLTLHHLTGLPGCHTDSALLLSVHTDLHDSPNDRIAHYRLVLLTPPFIIP